MTNARGFTLIEVLVAMSLIVFLMMVVISLVSLSLVSVATSRAEGAATKYSREELERIRSLRDQGGLSAIDCQSGKKCYVNDVGGNLTLVTATDPEQISGTVFSRYYQTQPSSDCQVTPTPGGPATDRRLVAVYVTWTDPKGNHQSKLGTCLAEWK